MNTKHETHAVTYSILREIEKAEPEIRGSTLITYICSGSSDL